MAAFQLKPPRESYARLLREYTMAAQFPHGDEFALRRHRAQQLLGETLRDMLREALPQMFVNTEQIAITRLSYGARRSAGIPRLALGGDEHFINMVVEHQGHLHHAFIYL